METKKTTQVNLSERTRLFIDALKSLDETEGKVLDALTETYGEEQGSGMVLKLPFEEIKTKLCEIMGIVICENQMEDKNLI